MFCLFACSSAFAAEHVVAGKASLAPGDPIYLCTVDRVNLAPAPYACEAGLVATEQGVTAEQVLKALGSRAEGKLARVMYYYRDAKPFTDEWATPKVLESGPLGNYVLKMKDGNKGIFVGLEPLPIPITTATVEVKPNEPIQLCIAQLPTNVGGFYECGPGLTADAKGKLSEGAILDVLEKREDLVKPHTFHLQWYPDGKNADTESWRARGSLKRQAIAIDATTNVQEIEGGTRVIFATNTLP